MGDFHPTAAPMLEHGSRGASNITCDDCPLRLTDAARSLQEENRISSVPNCMPQPDTYSTYYVHKNVNCDGEQGV